MTPIDNLTTNQRNEQEEKELVKAGVGYLFRYHRNHVADPPIIVGTFAAMEAVILFTRETDYWVAKATKPFPLKKILPFNNIWKYDVKLQGDLLYVGDDPVAMNDEIKEAHLDGRFNALTKWHIYTQQGLNAFVELAESCYKNKLVSDLKDIAQVLYHEKLIGRVGALYPHAQIVNPPKPKFKLPSAIYKTLWAQFADKLEEDSIVYSLGITDTLFIRNCGGEPVDSLPQLENAAVFFIDLVPAANWSHPCAYVVFDLTTNQASWHDVSLPPHDGIKMRKIKRKDTTNV